MNLFYTDSGIIRDQINKNKLSKFVQFNNDSNINIFEKNDVIFLAQSADINGYYDKFLCLPNKKVVFSFHEYIHLSTRQDYLKKYSNVMFLSPHLDMGTSNYDLSTLVNLYGFVTLFNDMYSDEDYLKSKFNKKRTKKINFFNRAINLRRAKVFELLIKNDIQFSSDVYYTFGLFLCKFNFPHYKTITEYINGQSKLNDGNKILNIDCEYLENNKNSCKLNEPVEYHYENPSFNQKWSDDHFNEINEMSLDSYISFVIESSGDFLLDCRYTEKTVRCLLFKNIFFTIGTYGFNTGLKNKGFETFNDIFGLSDNWDEVDELERVKIFTEKLTEFNSKSTKEIEELYYREDIQERLEKNYQLCINSFNKFETNLINEL